MILCRWLQELKLQHIEKCDGCSDYKNPGYDYENPFIAVQSWFGNQVVENKGKPSCEVHSSLQGIILREFINAKTKKDQAKKVLAKV
jgi:hypothetical protein